MKSWQLALSSHEQVVVKPQHDERGARILIHATDDSLSGFKKGYLRNYRYFKRILPPLSEQIFSHLTLPVSSLPSL